MAITERLTGDVSGKRFAQRGRGHLKNLRAKVVAWLRQLILNVGGKSTRKKEADAP